MHIFKQVYKYITNFLSQSLNKIDYHFFFHLNQIRSKFKSISQEQSGQQRVPIEYYQNIKNQLDQARSYIIQWQETNKKLYKDANELEGQLNEEVALNHNLRTQLQTLQDVNTRWEHAYHTLQSRMNWNELDLNKSACTN